MWWFLKKIQDRKDYVVYAYGRETKDVSGRIRFDKSTLTGTVEQAAENDTVNMATRFLLPHIYRVVVKENCPSERQIAIG